MTARRTAVATVALAALAGVLAPLAVTITPRLVYNPSASAPRGWYVVRAGTQVRAGDLVLAALPPYAAELAAARGYLPRGLPVVKRVAAVGGDRVCADRGVLDVSAGITIRALAQDRAGRSLSPWSGCRVLRADEVFLLGERSAASFDSRYFGPVSRAALIGVVQPLWTW